MTDLLIHREKNDRTCSWPIKNAKLSHLRIYVRIYYEICKLTLISQVSGVSNEIFRQIEMVENDHDATTAAALEVIKKTQLYYIQGVAKVPSINKQKGDSGVNLNNFCFTYVPIVDSHLFLLSFYEEALFFARFLKL